MNNVISEFILFLNQLDLFPDKEIEPGKVCRFPGVGKGSRNRSGWCVLFEDCSGGSYGDFSTWGDQSFTWFSKPDSNNGINWVGQRSKSIIKTKKYLDQKEACDKACKIWSEASELDQAFPYLKKKGVDGNGVKVFKGNLILPIRNIAFNLCSIQYINEKGQKWFLKGGQKKGCFCPISSGEVGNKAIIICEGWATGKTLTRLFPQHFVLAGMDVGNLIHVARAFKKRYPNNKIIIAGDDDRTRLKNPGRDFAKKAAKAIDAELIFPEWPKTCPESLSDFNDLELWKKRVKNG